MHKWKQQGRTDLSLDNSLEPLDELSLLSRSLAPPSILIPSLWAFYQEAVVDEHVDEFE